MSRILLCATLLCAALLWLGFTQASQVQGQAAAERSTAEALRQQVSAALANKSLLRADITWIKSKRVDTLELKPINPSKPEQGSTFERVPSDQRSKTKVVVLSRNTDGDVRSEFFVKGKAVSAADAVLLAYAGDPFLSRFRQGFPPPGDLRVSLSGLRDGGSHSWNKAAYRVLEAQIFIVSVPRPAPPPVKAGFVVPQAHCELEMIHWNGQPNPSLHLGKPRRHWTV